MGHRIAMPLSRGRKRRLSLEDIANISMGAYATLAAAHRIDEDLAWQHMGGMTPLRCTEGQHRCGRTLRAVNRRLPCYFPAK
jgi:hypothetical protein